jgi:eukaryotic-like serine/threonine-protein kinase
MSGHREFLEPGGAMRSQLFARLVAKLAQPEASAIGQRIGPFIVDRELGRGGMGTVYFAHRVEGDFEQDVALKLLRSGADTDATLVLFRRERQILARLDHPNIAHLIDGGCTDEGRLWFALEYVNGARIDAYCRERRLSPRARVALLRQVCAAVAFAHARLLVHGDIKPSNLLVTSAGAVKLLDFGIARFLAADLANTEIAARALTPGYASPEQQRGEELTTASDVFQLGLLIERVLATERVPDRVSTELSATHAGPPSSAVQTRMTPRDPDLAAIVARATAIEPVQRYAAVAALDADLAAWLEQRPVSARAGIGYRLRRFIARHRFGASATIIAFIAFISLASMFTWRLAHERDNAQRESLRAQATLGFLSDLLGEAQPAQHKGRVPTVEDLLQRGDERLATDTQQPAGLRGELLATLGSIHIERGEFAQAERLLTAALPLLRDSGAAPVRVAEASGNLAYMLDYAKAPEALAMLDQAIAALATEPTKDELRIRFLRYRASIVFGTGKRAEATAALQSLLSQAQAVLGEDNVETANIESRLAQGLGEIDRTDEALPHAEHAYKTLMRIRGADDPQTLQAGNRLAAAYYDLKRFEEDDALLRELLPHIASVFGATSPRYARALNWHGAALIGLKHSREAIEVLERALQIYDSHDPKDDLGSPNCFMALGNAYRQLGDDERAVAMYRAGLRRMVERPDAVPADSGDDVMKLVSVLVSMQRFSEAAPLIDEARSRARNTGAAKDDPLYASIAKAAAATHAAAPGHEDAARACADEALAAFKSRPADADQAHELETLLARLPQRSDSQRTANCDSYSLP